MNTNGNQTDSGDSEELKIILLATQPRMLREMLHRALNKAPEVRLIVETDSPGQITTLLERIQADWVVTTLGEDDRLPKSVLDAIELHPELSVVGLASDGSHAQISGVAGEQEEWERHRYSLDDVTLADLLHLIENSHETA